MMNSPWAAHHQSSLPSRRESLDADRETASSERDRETAGADQANDLAADIARDAQHPWGDPAARRPIDALLPLFERDLALPSGALVLGTDTASARRADAAGAPAVAHMGRICVGSRAPAPGSDLARKVVAHEAVHVAQMQRPRGDVDGARGGGARAAEAEATRSAAAFAAGGRLSAASVSLAPNAVAAFEDKPVAASKNDGAQAKALRQATGAAIEIETGLMAVRDARTEANDLVAALAGDTEDSTLVADLITSAVEAMLSLVLGGVSGVVATRLASPVLKVLVSKVLETASAKATAAATAAVGEAMAAPKSEATQRNLHFLALERGIHEDFKTQARAAGAEVRAGDGELPASEDINAGFDVLASAARSIQEAASRRSWLRYQAQAKLGRADARKRPAFGAGKPGGTALRPVSSGGVAGVMQIALGKDLATIEKAELPGGRHMQDRAMRRAPLRELGIPMRFEVAGTRKNVIVVNENGAASFVGGPLRQALYRMGGGEGEVGDRPEQLAAVERGLQQVVATLMAETLGDKLAADD